MRNFLRRLTLGLTFVLILYFSSSPSRLAQAEGATSQQTPYAAPPVFGTSPISYEVFGQKPKLVLVLVIDQFRSDYLTRFRSRFLPAIAKDGTIGGFEYLTSRGAYFPFAQYDVLQCMTGPGHAMILSGTYPYQSGISLNYWFDAQTSKSIYCVDDSKSPLVGAEGKGLSPRNLQGDTVGDELKNAGYPSRVVGIALKDRAAILLGGHRADLALWLDRNSYRWVSSRHYLPEGQLPTWVQSLNQELESTRGKPYVFAMGAHPTGLASQNIGYRLETTVGSKESLGYPLGLEITAKAAESAIENLKLGQGKSTDILAVSFSSHDYLAHRFGPNSAELEDLTASEDRIISSLLNSVRKKVPGGLKNAVVILTADHGGPPQSAFLKEAKITAGRIDAEELLKTLNARLDEKFGKPKKGNWFAFTIDLNFFMSPEVLNEKNISRETVENVAREHLQNVEGAAYVFTRTDYELKRLPPGMFARHILKSYIPGKNGEVILLPKPFFTDSEYAVSHLTDYSYDRMVPLILAGTRIRTGVYATPADIVDLAPTLSFLLGVLPPAASEGRVLSEILADTDSGRRNSRPISQDSSPKHH